MKRLLLSIVATIVCISMYSQTYDWNTNGSVIYSTPPYNVGIGTDIAPEKFTVNGNILATGSISGTSLNIVDIVSSGKEFKISTSVCMKGYDPLDPLSRNEICGMNNNLFIQSMSGSNYHTILNFGNTGNVGIGTLNPVHKLDVNGNIRSEKLIIRRIISEDTVIYFGDSSLVMNTTTSNLRTDYTNSYKGISIGFGSSAYGRDAFVAGTYSRAFTDNSVAIGYKVTALGQNSMVIGTRFTSGSLINSIDNSLLISFNTDKPTFFIGPAPGDGSYGKVGVGTNDPQATLHIENHNNQNYTHALTVTTNNALTKAYSITDNSSGTPTENFLVYGNGTLYCREVFVKLGTLGDFVFDKNYKLMPLKEVETYIEKNHHLPNIPSEEEVKKTDLNVGEMEAKLLQKIEELTLYLIQQNKDIEALQKQLEETQKQLEELKIK